MSGLPDIRRATEPHKPIRLFSDWLDASHGVNCKRVRSNRKRNKASRKMKQKQRRQQ